MEITTKYEPGDVVRPKCKTCLIDYIVKDIVIRISNRKTLIQYHAESDDRKYYFWHEKEEDLTLVRKAGEKEG